MFEKKREVYRGEEAIFVSNAGKCNLSDTLECGQAFRYEQTVAEDGYVEYLTVIGDILLRVGQRQAGELIFYGLQDGELDKVIDYFALDMDFEMIRDDVISRTDSEWLKDAAYRADGIFILRQDPWEALFSFIVSQNNNIPRIRKIIRSVCSEYGRNLAKERALAECPLKDKRHAPCDEICRNCGICYSFPRAEDVVKNPEGLLPSHPGFRYKYLLNAAERVYSGETDLEAIAARHSYEATLTELKKILGVGDKVASCVALFGFSNLEAFPVDVWMKRANDVYFGGALDPSTLGEYAGVAQQYIFHKIRNLEKNL